MLDIARTLIGFAFSGFQVDELFSRIKNRLPMDFPDDGRHLSPESNGIEHSSWQESNRRPWWQSRQPLPW